MPIILVILHAVPIIFVLLSYVKILRDLVPMFWRCRVYKTLPFLEWVPLTLYIRCLSSSVRGKVPKTLDILI